MEVADVDVGVGEKLSLEWLIHNVSLKILTSWCACPRDYLTDRFLWEFGSFYSSYSWYSYVYFGRLWTYFPLYLCTTIYCGHCCIAV